MSQAVNICEVGPRDGFQNVKAFIPTSTKLEIIDGLVRAGVRKIQCTSFASPKAVPQMADAADVAAQCLARYPDVELSALILNSRGAERATQCGLKKLSYVTSITDSHNMANVRKTVDEGTAELRDIRRAFPDIALTWDVGMSFGCIFDGEISYERLCAHIGRGVDLGVTSFTLCDTIGVANPKQVQDRVTRLMAAYPGCRFKVHIHDTRNTGIACTLAAIECGVTDVEVSIGGLGGCPFAPGASGNTSTEDLVSVLNRMDYDTGIDFDLLLQTAKDAKGKIDGNFSGHHIFITSECRELAGQTRYNIQNI